jgi:ATP-binding cassette, subfamily B, bacterial
MPFLRRYWLKELELLAYMVFDLGFSLAVPLSTKYLFDDIIAARAFERLWLWLVAVALIFVAGSAAGYRRQMVGGRVGGSILRDLRRQGFEQLQRLSMRFYSRCSTGDLMSRLTNDMDAIQGVLGGTLPQLLFQSVSLVVGTVVLLALNWVLGLVVLLIGVPIFAFVYIRSSRTFRQASREVQDRIGQMTSSIQENLAAQMVIKLFSLEARAINSFELTLGRLFDSGMRIIGIGAFLSGSASMIYLGIRLAVLGVGAGLIMNDMMSLGALVAFVGMIPQVLSPVMAVAEQYRSIQSAVGAFDRIQELMDELPDVVDSPGAVDLPPLRSEIRVEGVSFHYSDGGGGVQDISLAIPSGSRVAFVGPSGSGKSTLINLLLRLYDPGAGQILFDGVPIREGKLTSLRNQIAMVPQDTYLFNTTIWENIALGREGATDAEVVSAAEAAAVHDAIKRTEDGYQTDVGERGSRLSGGQRQRLAIARALIRDPRVLFLDEATSALDPETETSIMRTLDEVSRGRTTIMITHRLTSVVDCNVIFVLDQGRLVEQGTHGELCEKRGLYWRLYSEQQAGVMASLRASPVEPRRLSPVPLFASLTPAELSSVAQMVSVERCEPGAVIVRQGEQADKLYVIADGQVEVLVKDTGGTDQRVKLLGARGYFGEIALLDGDMVRRTATVRAVAATELYSLHKEDFLGLLSSQPRLSEAVSRLAQMRQEQSRRLGEMHTLQNTLVTEATQ